MARQLTLAYPGDLDTLTGGYIYDKRIVTELKALGWETHALSLDANFPAVDDNIKQQTAQQLSQIDSKQILVIDGLALGALGQYAKLIQAQRPFVALIHHPLALESGIDPDAASELRISERQALSYAQSVIVTSRVTKQTLIDQYAVANHKITVVEPGLDRPARWDPSDTNKTNSPDQPLKLLSVGALVPRKGFDVLINALGQLRALNWQLTVVGDNERAPEYSQHIDELIKRLALEQRITLLGALPADRLAKLYQNADLFVLASRYEGYGMAYTEALAWGLPVVGTNAGASAQTLDTAGAKIVPPDHVEALAAALQLLISNSQIRSAMRAAAQHYAQQLPTWAESGRLFSQALDSL